MNTTFDSKKLSLGKTGVCPLKPSWLMCLLTAAGLLLAGGCKKSPPPQGAHMDLGAAMANLNQSLRVPISPEVQQGLGTLEYAIHEGHYSEALTTADNLANNSGLTAAEKKALDGVREQLKPLASAPPPATAPGQ